MMSVTLTRPSFRLLNTIKTTRNSIRFKTCVQKSCAETEYDVCTNRQCKGLILGVYETGRSNAPKLTEVAKMFDEKVGGKLQNLIHEFRVTGKVGTGKVLHDVDDDFDAVAVVGLGEKDVGFNEIECINQDMENVRIAAAVGTKILQKQNCTQICVDGMDFPEQAAEGTSLTQWKFDDHFSTQEAQSKNGTLIKLFGSGYDANAWTQGLCKAEAQNVVRNLCELPSNHLTPTEFGQKALDLLCPCGVTVQIRDEEWIHDQKMDATMAVACTSCERPAFLEISYRGSNSDRRPVVIVGKGLTYNTGGLSLKSSQVLPEMRGSMTGAAVTIAAIRAAAQLKIPINIVGLIPMCEHMTSGSSIKLGDVIKFPNNKTIGIDDLSNAGSLIMADALHHAQTNYKPKFIVNVGSLANDVRYAFGDGVTPVFTNSPQLWCEIKDSSAYSGDRVWQMPLWKHYEDKTAICRSADATNIGNEHARSSKIACFLKSFTANNDFIHLDTHGVGLLNPTDDAFAYLKGNLMSGRPTRTLIQFLIQLSSVVAQEQR